MISIVIASVTEDLNALQTVINSILRPNCPYSCEVVVVTPNEKVKNLTKKNILYVNEGKPTGSCEAFNYGLKFTSGDFIGIGTDDILFKNGWWRFAGRVDRYGGFVSFKTGFLNVPVPHIFGFNRQFLNGPMKGIIFNPALTHMYIDNDLGFRLKKIGFKVRTYDICEKTIKHEDETSKDNSKLKSYKLDGLIFNHIWKNKYANLSSLATLYPDSIYKNRDLYKKMCSLLSKDISGEFYDSPRVGDLYKMTLDKEISLLL